MPKYVEKEGSREHFYISVDKDGKERTTSEKDSERTVSYKDEQGRSVTEIYRDERPAERTVSWEKDGHQMEERSTYTYLDKETRTVSTERTRDGELIEKDAVKEFKPERADASKTKTLFESRMEINGPQVTTIAKDEKGREVLYSREEDGRVLESRTTEYGKDGHTRQTRTSYDKDEERSTQTITEKDKKGKEISREETIEMTVDGKPVIEKTYSLPEKDGGRTEGHSVRQDSWTREERETFDKDGKVVSRTTKETPDRDGVEKAVTKDAKGRVIHDREIVIDKTGREVEHRSVDITREGKDRTITTHVSHRGETAHRQVSEHREGSERTVKDFIVVARDPNRDREEGYTERTLSKSKVTPEGREQKYELKSTVYYDKHHDITRSEMTLTYDKGKTLTIQRDQYGRETDRTYIDKENGKERYSHTEYSARGSETRTTFNRDGHEITKIDHRDRGGRVIGFETKDKYTEHNERTGKDVEVVKTISETFNRGERSVTETLTRDGKDQGRTITTYDRRKEIKDITFERQLRDGVRQVTHKDKEGRITSREYQVRDKDGQYRTESMKEIKYNRDGSRNETITQYQGKEKTVIERSYDSRDNMREETKATYEMTKEKTFMDRLNDARTWITQKFEQAREQYTTQRDEKSYQKELEVAKEESHANKYAQHDFSQQLETAQRELKFALYEKCVSAYMESHGMDTRGEYDKAVQDAERKGPKEIARQGLTPEAQNPNRSGAERQQIEKEAERIQAREAKEAKEQERAHQREEKAHGHAERGVERGEEGPAEPAREDAPGGR